MVEYDLLAVSEKIIASGKICDNCLGRQFAKLSTGLTNRERGRALRTVLQMAHDDREIDGTDEGDCWLCLGLFSDKELEKWATKVEEALQNIECRTFLIGTHVSGLLSENEEILWSECEIKCAEPLKSELNREVGKIVASRTDLEVEFTRPDVLIILDLTRNAVELTINPVFVFGRYQKLVRGIPQTRWPCNQCRGRGCERCNFTGKLYAESVEELIGEVALQLFRAKGYVLHGAGREDIDARMLGTGRPFILEIKSPAIREVDLKLLEEGIDQQKVKLTGLRYVDGSKVALVKSASAKKRYRVRLRVDGVPEDRLEAGVKALSGATIEQKTPIRVLHRRKDTTRVRKVFEASLSSIEDGCAVIEILGEAGLYVKELISGDEGRTRPSLAEYVGFDLSVEELDVLEVEPIEGIEI
ncbi:MAG: tRNA pseudouridine synthase [Candidatus Syntrophoarchaeum caldarius]|uniref:tRNA pseudouridine synthase Pus10 n=1 Tax=Candidatus Syntropharchaeum caldarium TaxID=1838285 RepID=A0A1F2P7K9_9EURY|nr:MAG: tRNA pseudouridine synthase [Candidatus Syntrophoarchaeum caldarius]